MSEALLLNAGASWAAYQVGAIEQLVGERRMRFDSYIGCGIGAMHAALLACGAYERIGPFWDSISTWKLVRPNLRNPWRAPMVGTPQRRFVAEHVSERALIANRATLAVTTFDLMTGEEVVHRYPGDPLPIVDAVMAAVATPGLLAPRRVRRPAAGGGDIDRERADRGDPRRRSPDRVVGVLAGIPLDDTREHRGSTGPGGRSPIGRSRSISPTTRAARSRARPQRSRLEHGCGGGGGRAGDARRRRRRAGRRLPARAGAARPARAAGVRLDQPVPAARLSAVAVPEGSDATPPGNSDMTTPREPTCEDRLVPHAGCRPHRLRGGRRPHVGHRGRDRLRRDRHLLGGRDQRVVRGDRAGRRARRAMVVVARPRHPRGRLRRICCAVPCSGRRASCTIDRNDAASSIASSPTSRSARACASAPTSPTSRPVVPMCSNGRARTSRSPRASTPRSRCRRWCARR